MQALGRICVSVSSCVRCIEVYYCLFLNVGSAVYNLLRPSAQWSGVRNGKAVAVGVSCRFAHATAAPDATAGAGGYISPTRLDSNVTY